VKVLFICSANKDRSATVELLGQELWPNHQFISAATNQKICFQLGTQYINKELMDWADIVFAMESKHKKELIKLFGSSFSKKIKVLDIKDHYEYGNSNLKEILKIKLQEYL
tara:strand:- start:127 stop:459 length:333 start_codon:yes stop_codon:yes gene_type:complete